MATPVSQTLNFQEVIMTLHRFWAAQGCVLWQPYNIQVGAGTNNPATLLRVLGPEPWRVAYVEPSIRPDDGRYAENPNRMQAFYQYQVILKPDPGNSQELYLQSLQAIGIDLKKHDVRFVEDNWESPAIGAWGLGWEVWLDGQEITQFTYFQQAGGIPLDVISVEITYGLERIVLALQNKNAAWDIDWTDDLTYADVFKRSEWEHSKYYFEVADVDALRKVYDTYEAESRHALGEGLVVPAYDYILKCSHLFNVLDTRGAIGVTERASYFRRMRDMTRAVAKAYVEQREQLEYPMMDNGKHWPVAAPIAASTIPVESLHPTESADLLLEIGTEELPAGDLDDAIAQLTESVPALLDSQRIAHGEITVSGTPRRLAVIVKDVAPVQPDRVDMVRGPSATVAFGKDGQPTKAAEGFAKKNGVPVSALKTQTIDGGQYVVATVQITGQPTPAVLAKLLPDLIAGIKFGKSMRWNSSGVAFSRPVRWIVALLGNDVIPFQYADIPSGKLSLGARDEDSPMIPIANAADYLTQMADHRIALSYADRQAQIVAQADKLAAEVGGKVLHDDGLLAEVTNLIEYPVALRGTFDPKFLDLPLDVLVMVMRKHQRYLAVVDSAGKLLPYFIAVRNGGTDGLDLVTKGNEHVLIARFTDAAFFFRDDRQHKLIDFLPRLRTLIVHEKLGSMFDKNERIKSLVAPLSDLLKLSAGDRAIADQAAAIVKADLATHMVVEMTALAGVMGREYAIREGQPNSVAQAIFEATLPRSAGDKLPTTPAGTLLALADRLDTLTGFFAAGVSPTASADPYGLRRAALGIVQILVDRQCDLDLRAAIDLTAAQLPIPVSDQVKQDLLDFISGRLRGWLLEDNHFAFDVVDAVLAAQSANPYRALIGCRELSAWIARPDWSATLDAYARCVRIVRSDAAKGDAAAVLIPESLTPAASQVLYQALFAANEQLNPAGNVDNFLSAFQPMALAITAFFDKVLVMDPDPAVRANRLALLKQIADLAADRADLSRLSGF